MRFTAFDLGGHVQVGLKKALVKEIVRVFFSITPLAGSTHSWRGGERVVLIPRALGSGGSIKISHACHHFSLCGHIKRDWLDLFPSAEAIFEFFEQAQRVWWDNLFRTLFSPASAVGLLPMDAIFVIFLRVRGRGVWQKYYP